MDLRDGTASAAAVIAALNLQPHPEGGHFRETWRDAPADRSRGVGTAIPFLLATHETSHWHRVDAAELWIWQAGAPLDLLVSEDGKAVHKTTLGPHIASQTLHGIVPKGHWQAASSLGAWTLVTCTVSPAFAFEGFELAPPGWAPGQ
jgi:predicted cupin superfamily sugar epimerase